MTNLIQKKWISFYQPFSKYVKNSLSNQIFSEQSGELVFILVLFLAITYKNDLLTFSQNFLGKLFLFILVVYFFIIQPKMGLFISIVLILFYYSDLIQSYYNYDITLFDNFDNFDNLIKKHSFENQYENMSNPIITKQIQPSQFPFFEGKFIGTLNAPDNTVLSINTDMSGNLKEFLTKFENDLIIRLEKGVNYDTGDNYLLSIPNITTSFSYVDGFMKGYFNYFDQNNKYTKGNFTGRLTGKVSFQRNNDIIIFKMKSLDSNVQVIKQINKLENTTINNMEDLTGCIIISALMKTGSITFNKNTTIDLPINASDGVLMFSGMVNSPSNSLDPAKSTFSLVKTYQKYPDPLSAYILSYQKQNFTASVKGTFMGLYLPADTNLQNITSVENLFSNIKILQGNLTCDISSTNVIYNKIGNYGMLNVMAKFTKSNIIPFDTNNYQNLPTQISHFTTISNSNPDYITTEQSIKENMETSQIKDAYPFTKDLVTIPSKFYTQYNYELPSTVYEKTQKESFFSDFFKKILSSGENPKEAFTTEPINIPHQKEYPNNSYLSQTQSQTQNTISPQTQNDLQNNQFPNPGTNPQIDEFRRSYCINNQLMYKNTAVNPEIAEYLFPNLQINGVAGSNGINCNPCDPTCPISFSNLDQRLENENIIQKRTHNEYNQTNHMQDWTPKLFDVFLPNPIYPEFNHPIKQSNSSYLIPANARITNNIL